METVAATFIQSVLVLASALRRMAEAVRWLFSVKSVPTFSDADWITAARLLAQTDGWSEAEIAATDWERFRRDYGAYSPREAMDMERLGEL